MLSSRLPRPASLWPGKNRTHRPRTQTALLLLVLGTGPALLALLGTQASPRTWRLGTFLVLCLLCVLLPQALLLLAHRRTRRRRASVREAVLTIPRARLLGVRSLGSVPLSGESQLVLTLGIEPGSPARLDCREESGRSHRMDPGPWEGLLSLAVRTGHSARVLPAPLAASSSEPLAGDILGVWARDASELHVRVRHLVAVSGEESPHALVISGPGADLVLLPAEETG